MMAHGGQAQAAGGPVNVVLLGHSYVRRLSEYAGQSPDHCPSGNVGHPGNIRLPGWMTLWPSKVSDSVSKTICQP